VEEEDVLVEEVVVVVVVIAQANITDQILPNAEVNNTK